MALSLCQTQHLAGIPVLQLPLQACDRSSETGESRMGSTRKPQGREADQRNETETAGKRFAARYSHCAGRGRARGAVPHPCSTCTLGGQGFCYSQVVVSLGAVLLLPPVDDDDGDGHADDEDGGDDASHDANDASGGTLR